MKLLYNIKHSKEKVSFSEALIRGLGKNQGLFFPINLPKFSSSEIDTLLKMNFIERSAYILSKYIGAELLYENILTCVKNAFTFPVPLVFIKKNIAILELFHGPTLAFKDFGSRLMASMLMNQVKEGYKLIKTKPLVILTATSGDTGAAVAHAFYGLKNIHVFILYPKDKISILQEKSFCTLGGNITTISVDGDFDICQSLVKQSFEDDFLKKKLHLNSANSINISRLLAQVCYYFEALSQISERIRATNKLVISVPSGNFGNLTAGLLAQSSGLPVQCFIIATNLNDTVPRFLQSGIWNPLPTLSTLSNAMDVSCPSNWSRIEELFRREKRSFDELKYGCVNDELTKDTINKLSKLGYIADPHTAVAYQVLCDQLNCGEFGICLGTAHPAKFKKLIEFVLDKKVNVLLPDVLKNQIKLPILSYRISGCFSKLRDLICSIVL
ncbi:threonine synthase [Candidatus Blochmanniella vafra str. BVAF]|uniref:Threonine synthase n=1 Tax=Blochmanniella vafra (strain BVAF) TaxID=859654 RepID=E8Q5M4_BLOVB|nr:threonine synthase [Candidatus Blochmannia vafer]ADV33521.1 threonine synthase [Candidatus Blochmannia vafer str. BVAF]